jgi:hypothetical protein
MRNELIANLPRIPGRKKTYCPCLRFFGQLRPLPLPIRKSSKSLLAPCLLPCVFSTEPQQRYRLT